MTEFTPAQQVRVLINDYFPTDSSNQIFSDDEITIFLALEGDSIKRAAAQAVDVIADNEALVSKVIKTQGGLTTDGAKVADSLRKRASALRLQALDDLATGDTGGSYVEFVPNSGLIVKELTERPVWPWDVP